MLQQYDRTKVLGMVADFLTIGGFIGLGAAFIIAAGWVGILGYLSACALIVGLAMAQAQLKERRER